MVAIIIWWLVDARKWFKGPNIPCKFKVKVDKVPISNTSQKDMGESNIVEVYCSKSFKLICYF